MGWRWRKSINLGGGARTTMTARGMGVSWGIAGFRIGRAPTGSLWASFTIPGTGISFFKYLSPKSKLAGTSQQPLIPVQAPLSTQLPHSSGTPMTHNQRVLDEIHSSKS